MILVFLGGLAIFLLAILTIMVWGAISNLIHVSRIAWRFLANSILD